MTRFDAITSDLRITGGPSGYAAARDGTGGLLSSDNEDIRCGQSPAGYYVYRGYAAFDTSPIPDGDTVTSVSLGLKIQQDNSASDFVVQVWKYDWKYVPNGTGVGTGNLRQYVFQLISSGANNNAAAVLETAAGASQSTAGKTAGSWMVFTGLSTSWVSKAGSTKYVLRSAKDTSAIAPTSEEWVKFYSANDGTYTNRPYLDIEYSSGGGGAPTTTRRMRIYAGVIGPIAFQELG